MNNPFWENIFMKPIVETEIDKIISKLDKTKSLVIMILETMSKKISKEVAIPLTRIFNMSTTSGEVPDRLKIAKVVPIYIKKWSQVFSNYRPMSVLF